MSGIQLTFAILGAAFTLAGLVWTITWAIRSWRKGGAEITAELGQGYVDKDGILHVFFQDGRSKIIRIEDDPQERRKKAQRPSKARAKKTKGRTRVKNEDSPQREQQAVNAVFARNSGRTAVTVTRCVYVLDLDPTKVFDFEAQPSVSPWGELLPKRIEAGEEILLLHDKETMWALLNAVMRNHGVFQTVYGVYLELGNGTFIFAGPPILTQAYMDDEEYAKVAELVQREEYQGPEFDEPGRLRHLWRFWRASRRMRKTLVREDDLHPDDLRAIRGKTKDRLPNRRRKYPGQDSIL
ncbi:hypothetical protein [Micromonospora sp. DT233]|uniref:hypothetical protein n=1 Tax=Micromonospora sp. DT233 TaxID=3393432 RepID=UPI003CF60768